MPEISYEMYTSLIKDRVSIANILRPGTYLPFAGVRVLDTFVEYREWRIDGALKKQKAKMAVVKYSCCGAEATVFAQAMRQRLLRNTPCLCMRCGNKKAAIAAATKRKVAQKEVNGEVQVEHTLPAVTDPLLLLYRDCYLKPLNRRINQCATPN